MFLWNSAVIDQSLVLCHTGVKWDIIVLTPSTKWVKKKNWVLESQLEELLTSIFEEEAVTIMEWVSDLEGINCISISSLDFSVDLCWGHSVVIHVVIERDVLDEIHAGSRDKPVTLGHDSLNLWVLERMGTKGSSGNFFLSIFVENWLVDDGKDVFGELSAFDGDLLLALECLLLLGGDVLGDWN